MMKFRSTATYNALVQSTSSDRVVRVIAWIFMIRFTISSAHSPFTKNFIAANFKRNSVINGWKVNEYVIYENTKLHWYRPSENYSTIHLLKKYFITSTQFPEIELPERINLISMYMLNLMKHELTSFLVLLDTLCCMILQI